MVGALLLVAAGLVLLLSNLGVVDSGAWIGMLGLWPVALIAVGLGLVMPPEARVARASIAGIALVGVTVGGVALWGQQSPPGGRVSDVEAALPTAVERADIAVEAGAARIRLSGGAVPAQAVTGRIGMGSGQRLVAVAARRDGSAHVRVAAEGRWFRLPTNPVRVAPWNLRVTDSVPVLLRVTAGVGEAQLDLRGLMVEEARVDVGLGRIVTILPDRGRPRVRIDSGIGQIVVRVPDTLPARVTIASTLATTSVEGDFRRENDVYTTAGWEEATERLDVVIEAGVGTVRVVRG